MVELMEREYVKTVYVSLLHLDQRKAAVATTPWLSTEVSTFNWVIFITFVVIL